MISTQPHPVLQNESDIAFKLVLEARDLVQEAQQLVLQAQKLILSKEAQHALEYLAERLRMKKFGLEVQSNAIKQCRDMGKTIA